MANFTKIDIDKWVRKDEFVFFSNSGCGFTTNKKVDITRLYNYAKSNKIKIYPLLVANMIKVMNSHVEFRYGSEENEFGYYDKVLPLFFDILDSKNATCLYCDYKEDVLEQVKEIEKTREQYKTRDSYRPQGVLPKNLINISCVPWVDFDSMSFCLQYCAYYYAPIITFGKFTVSDEKVTIPLSVYCNHAVNDGYHSSLVFSEFEKLVSSF